MKRVAALVCALALAACAHGQHASPPPDDTTKREVAAAEAAERHRQHDVARTHYEAAVAAAKTPESIAFARKEFAETLISWGEYPAATTQLETVVSVRADDAAAWHDLGMLYHHAGDEGRAINSLEKSRALAPNDPRPRVTLAVLRWKAGDLAGAKTEYQDLLKLDLPDRLREKVEWAIRELSKPAGGPTAVSHDPSATAPPQ
ncbi:MAG TPA: tetratricopeptide repeat protein [Kofleriaceae bacterium]